MTAHTRFIKGLRIAASFALLAAILACGGSDSSDEPPPVEPTPPPAPAPPPTGVGATNGPPESTTTTNVALRTGFMPDPHTVNVVAGGTARAMDMDPSCRGYLPAVPQVTFNAGTDFSNLRVLANGGTTDTTLVIRQPDGTYRCDDDGGEGLQPQVGGAWGPGTYQVYVGVYQSGRTAHTSVGFTELSSVTTSSLTVPTQ